MEKVDIHIEGMHCAGCANGIQLVAEGMDGITSARVDFDAHKGTFEFDSAKVTPVQIIAELQKIGYAASL